MRNLKILINKDFLKCIHLAIDQTYAQRHFIFVLCLRHIWKLNIYVEHRFIKGLIKVNLVTERPVSPQSPSQHYKHICTAHVQYIAFLITSNHNDYAGPHIQFQHLLFKFYFFFFFFIETRKEEKVSGEI